MNRAIKISSILLFLFITTVTTLYSQKVKSTLRILISTQVNQPLSKGDVTLEFENGTPAYYVVLANDNNMFKERITEKKTVLKNIPFGYYTIAVTDTNKLFFIGNIDLK